MRLQRWLAILLVSAGALLLAMPGRSQSSKLEQEPACQTLKPASAGGPIPKDPNIAVLRYFSYASFELVYQGKVLLLDAYYDNSHPPEDEPAGLKESDITKADVIFVGHTHLDHFLDAPAIAKRTGAPIYLGPPGLNYLHAQGVPESQIKILRGGETIKRDGYTVQAALGIHMVVPPNVSAAYTDFIAKSNPLPGGKLKWIAETAKSPTPDVVIDPLNPDTDTIYHGTIVYVLTFDNGFRLVYSDSDGNLSNGERVLADSIHAGGGKIDVAILGYLGDTPNAAIRTTLTRVNVWKPNIFIPSHHHNGDSRILPEMPTAPLFEALRDQAPDTRGVAPLYRSPICVNTKTDELFVGNYVR